MPKLLMMFIYLLVPCHLLGANSFIAMAQEKESVTPLEGSKRKRLETKIRSFTEAFDSNDLDAVMTYFAPDATYRTIQGDLVKGKDEIRKAFEPQFNGAYGKMIFVITEVNIDETQNKLTLTWTCHHDFGQKATGFKNEITRVLYWVLNSKRSYWYGLDSFEFDSSELIKTKSSFTTSKIPRMFKDS